MSAKRAFRRWSALVVLGLVCSAAAGEEKVEDRRGTFARVGLTNGVYVMRFNREYYFELLGVDPVTSLGREGLERQAKTWLATFLSDRKLVLVLDESGPGKGNARNYAGYVYTEDGTFVNAEVLKRGYGKVDREARFSKRGEFEALEAAAREARVGVWAAPGDDAASAGDDGCTRNGIAEAGRCGVTLPELIVESRVNPVYPGKARRKSIDGRVVLLSVVMKDGSVRVDEVVESPSDLLTQAGIAAVEQWRYRPGTKEGVPVDVYFTVVVDFLLTR